MYVYCIIVAQVFKDKFDEVKKQNEATLSGKSTTKPTESTSTDSSKPTETSTNKNDVQEKSTVETDTKQHTSTTAEPTIERKDTEQSSDSKA